MFRRALRLRIALAAVFGLLFQQIAVATYVCDVQHAGGASQAAMATPDSGMPCHDERVDAARCHAHCHPVTGKVDASSVPGVPPSIVPAVPHFGLASSHANAEVLARARPRSCANAPPFGIAYCSLQI